MEEFPASTVHLQPATSLLASWGVVIGQNSFSGRWGGGGDGEEGKGVSDKQHIAAIFDVKAPHTL